MTVREFAGDRPSTPSIPQVRYARLWKTLVSGTVPPRTADAGCWYRAAQHVIGQVLHDVQVRHVLGGGESAPQSRKQQDAA